MIDHAGGSDRNRTTSDNETGPTPQTHTVAKFAEPEGDDERDGGKDREHEGHILWPPQETIRGMCRVNVHAQKGQVHERENLCPEDVIPLPSIKYVTLHVHAPGAIRPPWIEGRPS